MRIALRPFRLGALAVALVACPPPLSEPQPLATGPGALLGPPVTVVLGPDGGRLASADGRLTLVVPPGALAQATTFGITPAQNLAPGGLGPGFELSAGGASFGLPVRLAFLPSGEDPAPAELSALGLVWQDDGGVWHWLEGAEVDLDAGTLTVDTTHFTRFAPATSSWLVPLYGEVREGESTTLEVQQCYVPTAGTNGAVGIGCTDLLSSLVAPTGWSVNGQLGGNAVVGTIHGSGLTAIYTAPATAPGPPTVTVSTTLEHTRWGKAVLFSRVRVGQVVDLEGTFTLVATLPSYPVPFTVKGVGVLTRKDTGPDETNYLLSGTATITPTQVTDLTGASCQLVSSGPQAIPHQDAFKVRLTPRPAVAWTFHQEFTYHCQGGGLPARDAVVAVEFATSTGFGCGTRVDIPTANPKEPQGTSTWACLPPFLTQGTWHFWPR